MSVRSVGIAASSSTALSPLPGAAPYTTTIPLDGSKTMPRTFVSTPTTFTVGATANGGQAVLPLVADGVNAPTFSGFTEAGTSSGYNNTAGILNLIQFFYLDGTPYFSVSQAVNAQPILQAATAYTLTGPSTATIGSASTNFTVRSNGALASAVTVTPSDGGAGGTFTPSTVALAANSSGTSSATFTYTPAGSAGSRTISTANNGGLTNPSALSVTATVTSTLQYVRLNTSGGGLTEVVDSPGYDYNTSSTDVTYASGYGVSSIAIPANADGYFGATNKNATTGGLLVSLGSSASSGAFTNTNLYGMYADTSNSGWRLMTGSTGNVAPTTNVPIAAGDVARVRRVGTTVVAEVSKDNGSTFTTIYTWTGVSTAPLYGHFQICSTLNTMVQPFASSNAQ